ncbi:MAG: alpha/beta fold hydrolase [Candidatus Eremiobacteraeota bacterium]|nr:alpha/beta fold hydrolase [Candidatus Eremiobacteraeota bacterium]
MRVDLRFLETALHRVAVLYYEPRRPRGVTLVVGHGYSSSKHNLDFLCNFLASHGFAAYSLDFPGHKLGASTGRLSSLDDLIDAMGSVVEQARDDGARVVYTVGHSMGATTAILTAAADRSIAGVVAIATGLGRLPALDALGLRGATDLRSSYVDGLSLPELLAQTDTRLEAALPALAGRPQLYVAGERDGMVAPRSVRALFDAASEPKTFETIASDHTYAGENARSTVLAWLGALHPRETATRA